MEPSGNTSVAPEVEKVELFVTSSSGVRQTFQECLDARRVLETLMADFEERDVFADAGAHEELKRRMGAEAGAVAVPQLFVDGRRVGDARKIEQLNETGELRKILFPNKVFPKVNSSLEANVSEESQD